MTTIKRNPLRISGALGWYFDVLRTCDSLEREILDYFGQHDCDSDNFDKVLEDLPLRKKLHCEVDDPILSGRGRSAALAMSVLIVYNHNDEYFGLVQKRSSFTAVHSDLYHVVPSFMVGPECGAYAKEWNVLHQIKREFLEEALNCDEPKNNKSLKYDWFYKHKSLQDLDRMLREKEASFYITGITINLLNLRPEICGLLLIDSQNWVLETELHSNWEFDGKGMSSSGKSEKVTYIPIDNDQALLEKVSFIPENVVPPGAAALWLGVDKVRKLRKLKNTH